MKLCYGSENRGWKRSDPGTKTVPQAVFNNRSFLYFVLCRTLRFHLKYIYLQLFSIDFSWTDGEMRRNNCTVHLD